MWRGGSHMGSQPPHVSPDVTLIRDIWHPPNVSSYVLNERTVSFTVCKSSMMLLFRLLLQLTHEQDFMFVNQSHLMFDILGSGKLERLANVVLMAHTFSGTSSSD